MSGYEQNIARLIRIASAALVVFLGLRVSPGLVAALSARGDVELAVMWSMIRRPGMDTQIRAPDNRNGGAIFPFQ